MYIIECENFVFELNTYDIEMCLTLKSLVLISYIYNALTPLQIAIINFKSPFFDF